jgi:sulfonate transport system permease protein
VLASAALPVLLLGAWWGLGAVGVLVPLTRVPDPVSLVRAIADLVAEESFADHLRVSLVRVGIGFTAGSAVGLALRGTVRRWPKIRVLLMPLVAVVRAVPSVAWLPLLVVVLGVGEPAIVPLVAVGATGGLLSVHRRTPRHLEVVPARHELVGALRGALRRSWLVVATAELLGARTGLGFLIAEAGRTGSGSRFFAAMIALSTLAAISEALLALGAIPASSRGFRPARTAS